MLKQAVESLARSLDSTLHSGVQNASLIHIMMFVTFLEAALGLRNKRSLYSRVLDRVKHYVPLPFRAHLTRLVLDAARVIREVERIAGSATVTEEASSRALRKRLATLFWRRIDSVFVVDALSPIEFASLLVIAGRNGYFRNLSSEYLVNPTGATWFVKEQIREEEKRLRKYAEELAGVLMSSRHRVSFTFDKAIHSTIGDITTFIRDEKGRSPLEAVWEEIRTASEEDVGAAMLLTTDHGYSVYEDEGALIVDHGRRNDAILALEPIALVAILGRSEV